MSTAGSEPPNPARGPWMTLYSGQRYYPFSPKPHDVTLENEAHALAALPRFNGHARTFNYCVAHHCVLVSLVCEAIASSADIPSLGLRCALAGLHHDGGEFIAGDLPRPIKHHLGMASYREFDKLQQQAVASRWHLGDGKSAITQRADEFLLAIEMRDLMIYQMEDWRQEYLDDDLKTLRKRWLVGCDATRAAARILLDRYEVETPGALLRHGVYGQPAMDLFLKRHHELVAACKEAEAIEAAAPPSVARFERERR